MRTTRLVFLISLDYHLLEYYIPGVTIRQAFVFGLMTSVATIRFAAEEVVGD
jgi:hypothetical protein